MAGDGGGNALTHNLKRLGVYVKIIGAELVEFLGAAGKHDRAGGRKHNDGFEFHIFG